MLLTDSVTNIKGIGEKTAASLAKLSIHNVEDLLRYYPRSYTTYDEPVDIGSIESEGRYAIKVAVNTRLDSRKVRSLTLSTMTVRDFTGTMKLVWFNCAFLRNYFRLGGTYVFVGDVKYQNGVLTMTQPEYFTPDKYDSLLDVWQPIYACTSGITSKTITKAVKAVDSLIDSLPEYLPEDVRDMYSLPSICDAVRCVHFPANEEALRYGLKRIAFDEFYEFIAGMSALQSETVTQENTHVIEWTDRVTTFIEKLPYRLTNAQINAVRDIFGDMSSGAVMNRLVQGDVGSGKTIVSAIALLATAFAGYQGVIMAPTEVLASQHYNELSGLFEKYGIRVSLLTGSMTAKERRKVYSDIEHHETDVVVGTHALIQDKVAYADLGLVVTDEQHRFGVKQRETLSLKGHAPHVLVMSATPIPRTLAIIMYGDLDISIIDELPAGRIPIKNCVVNEDYRRKAHGFILSEVKKGHQVYIVCPMVEESEAVDDVANVVDYTEKLRAIFPNDVRITCLHGRMKGEEKNEILGDFSQGNIDILVSTTVIEVGINNPNATVMMVENAERFGLAALHQLRGRVGRGKLQSYCIFISGRRDKDVMERLGVLETSNDGFHIASEDLKRRGPGDFFGIRQSGDLFFKIGDIYKHADMLKAASDIYKRYGFAPPGASQAFTKAIL